MVKYETSDNYSSKGKKSEIKKKKNFRILLNKPLFKITFDKIKNTQRVFDIYIDSSSKYFESQAIKYRFNFIKRPKIKWTKCSR